MPPVQIKKLQVQSPELQTAGKRGRVREDEEEKGEVREKEERGISNIDNN